MKCHYHPDCEPVGMCVACGQPICVECKVELDNKFYCNLCVVKGHVTIDETGSWAWWLFPIILGIIGGSLAFSLRRSVTPVRSSSYFIVGCGITIWQLAFLSTAM